MKIDTDDLITQSEAAEIRGVSVQSINDLIRRGRLKTITIGKRKFLSKSAVKKFKPSPAGRPRKTPAKRASKRIARPRQSR